MGALVFGEKEALVKDAWRRIKDHPNKYVPQVYGEKTVGGASMMYLSSVPFDLIGLQLRGLRTDLGDVPFTLQGREWMGNVPFIALAVGGATLALYRFNQRRARVEAIKEKSDDRK
jgi:formate dehydrogenase iron-sulfur subunit